MELIMIEKEKKTKKSEYQKKWRELHKEEMYAFHRLDYQKHRDARLKWQHEYYLKNKNKRSKNEKGK
jgi:hypothetical protein